MAKSGKAHGLYAITRRIRATVGSNPARGSDFIIIHKLYIVNVLYYL